MAVYTLPGLPYSYAALESYISGTTMELHHDKHHADCVDGTNAALEELEAAHESDGFTAINLYEKNLALNLGGRTNHAILWQNMTPDAQERPGGKPTTATDEYFGSFEKFQGRFAATALGLQGLGWGVLTWNALSKRLVTFQLADQQGNIPVVTIPLFILDMQEHTFYLGCQNVKTDYVKAWQNVMNWADIAARFERVHTQYTDLTLT